MPADIANPLEEEYQRKVRINGTDKQINNRAVVLESDAANWGSEQTVYVFAPDDPRSEGDRVVVTQHSVISVDERFDAVDVRNVEVLVRDNDTPGIFVTQVEAGTDIEDGRTLVIEGTSVTELTDEVLVRLAKAPDAAVGADSADVIVVNLNLDEESDEAIRLIDVLSDPRFDASARTITHVTTSATRTRVMPSLPSNSIRWQRLTLTATTCSRTCAPDRACWMSRSLTTRLRVR
jgi:hypothetical protein